MHEEGISLSCSPSSAPQLQPHVKDAEHLGMSVHSPDEPGRTADVCGVAQLGDGQKSLPIATSSIPFFAAASWLSFPRALSLSKALFQP